MKELSEKVKETLEKQLDILSKRQETACEINEIIALSHAIAEILRVIIYPLWLQEEQRASRQC